ncbi:hypothetical protein SAMN04515671_1954 [Nakamurella panacisegetis]|uniref:Alpha/beta hydrolase family protein n=1 Tax=Nakamurella panacisegetis TaxID=1090615 RepID=A0A1H0M9W6_9ACTN|nr:alpha/beta hydrolase [Nakamurella panacisegetis]SDO77101.1 hypothetical protein SAMN04515671_1954 [Nakamurella panacisegetis]
MPETRPSFLVLHGFQNHRPAGHWQHLLTDDLRAAGHPVSYPPLPDPDHPDRAAWLGKMSALVAAMPTGHRVVVTHSLAAVAWLHAAALGTVSADRVLLVAPPSPAVLAGIPEVAAFAEPTVTAAQLAASSSGPVRLVASDDDPYHPDGAAATYGTPLAIDTDVIPGAGHLDLTAGYGRWPSVLAWCLDPSTRLTART